jgi:hypothetical protein
VLDEVDAGLRVGTRRFGEPCDAGAECGSSLCVNGPQGAFCTVACSATADAGCPTSFSCKVAPDVFRPDGGLSRAVCTVPQPLLCQGCSSDSECGASGADRCLSLEGGRFCGRDCSVEGCPSNYRCEPASRQCVADGRTCDCTPQTLGLEKGCLGP